MKKTGILNQPISTVIAGLGHTDTLVIADAGLPIPDSTTRIDLALIEGIPSFEDTLRAILGEMQVERAIIAEEMSSASPDLHERLRALLGDVPVETVPHEEFKEPYIGLRYTRFGLHVRAVGGDEEITRLAGVPTNRVIFLVYVISGLTAAIGGVLLTGRLWSAQPQAAVGWELDAIAASVLGGTSLAGGIGGTLAGAFIIGILSNGLNLLGISSYTQQVIEGAVFILAVLFDLLTKRGRTTRRRQRTPAQEPV